uniref:DUF6248 family natural product biosynthesis protein n=1 Tax=Amycolatopsis sp. CA-151526 TaxID=3239921 RepID=UPI003F49504A
MTTLAHWGPVDGQEALFAPEEVAAAASARAAVPAAARVPAMTKEQARWIREVVWTEHHRKWCGGPRDWHRCRCQWGVSDNCRRGEHRTCTKIRSSGPLSGPDTYLTISGDKRLHVAVWLADRTCRWTCPCNCGHRHQLRQRAGTAERAAQR